MPPHHIAALTDPLPFASVVRLPKALEAHNATLKKTAQRHTLHDQRLLLAPSRCKIDAEERLRGRTCASRNGTLNEQMITRSNN